MKYIVHKSASRGYANHVWLKSNFTFSFADYYDAERINFGVLRVINDDTIIGHNGFDMHPHKNMEIITFPISGGVEHQDSMGNRGVVSSGEIQVMSAGSGIYHSEYNASKSENLQLLQIWIMTGRLNVEPRYSQFNYLSHLKPNEFLQIVSPNEADFGAWIHQNGFVSYGEFDAEVNVNYKIKADGNGLYVFVIQGDVSVNGVELQKRDGVGIWNCSDFQVNTRLESKIILFDIGMIV